METVPARRHGFDPSSSWRSSTRSVFSISFLYDADGARVRRRAENGPVTTFYLGGVHEIEINGDIATAQAPTAATQIPDLDVGASVLLVVGEDVPLTTADTALSDRLADLGFVVTALDDDDADVTTVVGFDLIVLSATVSSTVLGTTFKVLTTPLVNMKPFAQLFELGMSEVEGVSVPSIDTVTIVDSTSPLAAGLAGLQYLTTDERALGWGVKSVGSDMNIVATTPEGNPALYWYEPGDNMAIENGVVSTAPGCRVQFPGHKTAPNVYTKAGWDMFDRAMWWAVSAGCTFGQPQPESTTTPFCQTGPPPEAVPPEIQAKVEQHWVSDILVVGDIAYITGNFESLVDADGTNTYTRSRLGACDLTTGDVVAGFPDFGLDDVGRTLAVDGNMLYVGGKFTEIGGNTALGRLARIDLTTNTVDASWDPNPNKSVLAIEFSTSKTSMFVGGNFSTFGPNDDPVDRLVKITTLSGDRNTSFTPDFDGDPPRVFGLWNDDNGRLYVGGDFEGIADGTGTMQTRTGLGSVSTSSGNVTTAFAVNTLEDHNPLEGPLNPVPTVESVFEYDGQIYACGDWWTTDEQGQPIWDDPDGKSNQYNVGRFDPTSGDPDKIAGGETYQRYPAVYPPEVAAEEVQELVARIVKTYTNRPWGPRNDGGVADCIPDPTSGLMYVAGHWDFVTGPNSFTDTLPIGKVIAVDLDSGLTINTWDAETNSDRGLDALAVIPGEAIIIGGAFTQTGGQNLNGLARFNLLSASTLTPPQPDLDILLVVANPAGLQAGETAIKDRLETQGATVTVADDNTVTQADADAVDVVLVSQGVSSSAVNTKLNNTSSGVVVWKPSLYDDLGLTTAAGGTTTGQTQLDIVDPTHPIADGLSGTVTVYDSSKKTTFGTPAATAAVVADTAGASTTPVVFTYDTGDTLANATTAAGRRVGFYFDTNAPTVASSDGWVLFDATVTWTANSQPPISQRSTITLAGVAVATVSQGEVTWLVADNLGSPTVTYRAVGETPASVALYYPYGSPRTPQIEGTGTGFTGQVSDLESGTGLAFYNARYYDPALGRFTQPDTIIPNASNGQDYNRYSYVRNNPVNFTDPSGRCIEADGTIMAGFPECDFRASEAGGTNAIPQLPPELARLVRLTVADIAVFYSEILDSGLSFRLSQVCQVDCSAQRQRDISQAYLQLYRILFPEEFPTFDPLAPVVDLAQFVIDHPLESTAFVAGVLAIPATGGASVALSVTSVVASGTATVLTCSESVDASCVISGLGTLAGAVGAGAGATSYAIAPRLADATSDALTTRSIVETGLISLEVQGTTYSLGFGGADLIGLTDGS